MNRIKEFIEKQRWIFAKTYANKSPHEYIVRDNFNGTDEEFMDMVNYIQQCGQTIYYWSYPNKYLYLDGRYYWVMTDNMKSNGDEVVLDLTDPTIVINRSNAKEYILSIRWKGLSK